MAKVINFLAEEVKRTACNHCRAIVEYNTSEGVYMPRSGTWFITCPNDKCRHPIILTSLVK